MTTTPAPTSTESELSAEFERQVRVYREAGLITGQEPWVAHLRRRAAGLSAPASSGLPSFLLVLGRIDFAEIQARLPFSTMSGMITPVFSNVIEGVPDTSKEYPARAPYLCVPSVAATHSPATVTEGFALALLMPQVGGLRDVVCRGSQFLAFKPDLLHYPTFRIEAGRVVMSSVGNKASMSGRTELRAAQRVT